MMAAEADARVALGPRGGGGEAGRRRVDPQEARGGIGMPGREREQVVAHPAPQVYDGPARGQLDEVEQPVAVRAEVVVRLGNHRGWRGQGARNQLAMVKRTPWVTGVTSCVVSARKVTSEPGLAAAGTRSCGPLYGP